MFNLKSKHFRGITGISKGVSSILWFIVVIGCVNIDVPEEDLSGTLTSFMAYTRLKIYVSTSGLVVSNNVQEVVQIQAWTFPTKSKGARHLIVLFSTLTKGNALNISKAITYLINLSIVQTWHALYNNITTNSKIALF